MRTLTALVVTLIFTGCQSAPPCGMTEDEVAKVESEVLEWADAWMAILEDPETSCERREALLHPDYWHEYLVFQYEPSELTEICTLFFPGRTGYSGSWISRDVRVLSPDAAVLIGTYSDTVEWSFAGWGLHHPAGTQMFLLERTSDGWGATFWERANGPGEKIEVD